VEVSRFGDLLVETEISNKIGFDRQSIDYLPEDLPEWFFFVYLRTAI